VKLVACQSCNGTGWITFPAIDRYIAQQHQCLGCGGSGAFKSLKGEISYVTKEYVDKAREEWIAW